MLLIILGTILNFYTNDVIIKRADSTFVPTIGMEIQDNDTVIANDSSQAELLYADSSTLYIDENSRISTSGTGKRSVFLSVGRVWAKIKKLMRGESFEVKSALSISGVLGTEFEVSFIDDESQIKVIEGKVSTQDKQSGREVILEKERMAKIRKNMEMEVKEFKLKELKRWYEWKKDHLDFLLMKIENALIKGRTMQASRLIAQGHVLAGRLKLTDEYKSRIEELQKKYEQIEEKHGLIENRINSIDFSCNAINSAFSRKQPKLMELSAKIKRLSLQTAELESYVIKQRPLLAKQQLKVMEDQIRQIEMLIKDIKPQEIYEWDRKVENDYDFLDNAQNMPALHEDLMGRVKITSKRIKELKERIRKAKIVFAKDLSAFKKIKLELVKFKININQR